ncbi:Transcriptional regulator MraZ [Aureliella helgolandensis]|uniref:Transcriptional regulator MraZ n=2 Tax=Aureliella helgolandensis TaxID=2527968 RepID=A0A518GDC7_9BACT|nr:Transcriptional regulator MraZ [Aureliella helgolandensis]|tara:strand:+ start:285 stop:749 length:465 start_codon:yes stop_codon:yes gene_type:complete
MLLTGSYRRSLDDKLRLAIPKQLRDALGFPDKKGLFIAPGTDRSLVIYTAEVIEQIGNTLSKLSPVAKETRAFSRLFYAQAQPAEIDKQGRLRIPPELAKLSDLTAEVVVVGVRDRIELWDANQWDAFLSSTQPSYDELAEHVFQVANPVSPQA